MKDWRHIDETLDRSHWMKMTYKRLIRQFELRGHMFTPEQLRGSGVCTVGAKKITKDMLEMVFDMLGI